jgi:hypothetical protein
MGEEAALSDPHPEEPAEGGRLEGWQQASSRPSFETRASHAPQDEDLATRCIACGTQSHSPTTLFLNTPIPLISISHTSPGFMFSGMPSVPIHITSPGSMVQYRLTSEM